MRINRILKTTGFLTLFGISVFLSVSLSAQLAQSKGKFPLVQMAESEGWCQSSSHIHSASHMVYAFYDPKETIVLFNDQNDPTSPLNIADKDLKTPYDGAGYRANYPEIAFVSLVALRKDAGGGYSIYDGGNGEIKVKMRLKTTFQADEEIHFNIKKYITKRFSYQLIDLYGKGSELWNFHSALPEDELSRGIIDWKGFFLALDNGSGEGIRNLKGALAQTNEYRGYEVNVRRHDQGRKWYAKWERDAPNNDIEIFMGESGTPVSTIAVKSWHCDVRVKHLPFELENIVEFAGDLEAKIIMVKAGNPINIGRKGKIDIDVNVNNVDLVRRNMQRYINGRAWGGSIRDFIPNREAGEVYTGDPGPFVVKGMVNERAYSKIIEILVDAANGREDHPSSFIDKNRDEKEGDEDWVEVAAANIYDHPDDNTEKVFRCVWAIGTTYKEGHRGSVSPYTPYKVYFNPLNAKMRFNVCMSSGYKFLDYTAMDNTVFHEAIHTYLLVHGEGVYDSEVPTGWESKYWGRCADSYLGDELYVAECDSKNPYLTFSHDHKERGFLSPRFRKGKADPVGDYLYGQWGSTHSYPRHTYCGVPDSSRKTWKKRKYLKKDEYGHFITRIDDRLVNTTNPDEQPYLNPNDPKFKAKYNAMRKLALERIFYGRTPVIIESDMPDDLPPRKKNSNRITGVYLYKPPLKPDGVGRWRLLDNENAWIALSLTKERHVEKDYGSYEACRYSIDSTTNSYTERPRKGLPKAEDCLKMIEQGYHLYVRYSILYHYDPDEYDAEYFAITHGEQDE